VARLPLQISAVPGSFFSSFTYAEMKQNRPFVKKSVQALTGLESTSMLPFVGGYGE
jgi:hypothetical protein